MPPLANNLPFAARPLDSQTMIRLPASWEVISYALVALLAVATVYLSMASYGKVVVANGELAASTGVAAIIPSKPGTVSRVLVRDGMLISRGTPLAEIQTGTYLHNGEPLTDRVHSQLLKEDQELARQQQEALAESSAEERQVETQLAGLRSEEASLSLQVQSQQALVKSAADDLRKTDEIAKSGFISAHEQQGRRDLLTSRILQLHQLQQLQVEKRSDIANAQASIAPIQAKAQQQVANVDSQRTQLAQQVTQNEATDSYVITAPVAGRITSLAAQAGAPVDPQQQLMMIVPQGAGLEAKLTVPTNAIAFVQQGQEVRLAVDAFPLETYGPLKAKVASVAGAATRVQGSPETFYLVTARLPQSDVAAFGRRYSLRPGMTLTARIATQKRSLLQWLFEPLLAVRRR